MAYPDDLLSPDEHVVVHRHPHWKMLFLPVLVLIVVLGGGTTAAVLLSGQSWAGIADIALAVVGLALVIWAFAVPFARWRTTHFIVTSDRVMYREGVFKRTGLDIPLSRINSVRF